MRSLVSWLVLAGWVSTGCAGGPQLRLERGGGDFECVEISEQEFAEGMRRLAQEMTDAQYLRLEFSDHELTEALEGIARGVEQSRSSHQQAELSEGKGWDTRRRERLAMAVAMTHFYDGAAAYARESVDPTRLRAVLAGMIVWYLGMLVIPEPVSKVIAVNLTVAMIAYVGVDTFLGLVEGYRQLKKEVAATWSFGTIAGAGEQFGLLVGGSVGRAFVMLASWAMARTAGHAARIPDPPRWAAAAQAAAGRYGINLQAAVAGGARTVSVAGPTLTITLAPGTMAMQNNHGHNVYISTNPSTGETTYAGITNNFARRAYEQLQKRGLRIKKLMDGLSREDARAVEQALIEIHGLQKNGGTLMNRINSIAKTNPSYARSVKRGLELLRSIGYLE